MTAESAGDESTGDESTGDEDTSKNESSNVSTQPSDVDLTPKSDYPDEGSGRRSVRNYVILSGLAVVLGFVLFQALTSARVFFYNVDEAVEQRSELGDQRFRMQGTVTTSPDLQEDGSLFFDVTFNGETAAVRHIGDAPSALFECNTPVVIEGRWVDNQFQSELITVKHSEEYEEENPDRVDYAVDKPAGSAC